MSEVAIRAEGLSKRYHIGALQRRHNSLRDHLADAFASPFRRVRSAWKGEPSRSEDAVWALKDVSFEIRRGDVVGVIGRNGAGKTTLLRVLSRITDPTEGHAEIHGRVGSLLEVGTGFHPELTGRENIYLNGAILGMRKVEILRRFDEIVGFAEVDRFIDTPVKRYSSGMQVRLAFAVAAHLDPEVLLVDEVLAVGDASFQRKCLGKMRDVARGGRTVMFVSHDMGAVRALCDSALLLEGGRETFRGNAKSVIELYLSGSSSLAGGGKLTPDMHLANSGEVWMDQVALINATGSRTGRLRMGEEFTITILLEILRPVRRIRIGAAFHTVDGLLIATSHHTDDGASEGFSGDRGKYRISMTVRNQLLPGAYVLSVGAHDALGGRTIEFVPTAARFDVLDIAVGDVEHHRWNPGIVHWPAVWSQPTRVDGENSL